MTTSRGQMKAVFINEASVLRDSHLEPGSPVESWRLVPATLEAMRMLATEDTLIFLYGPETEGQPREGEGHKASAGLRMLAQQIEAGGGRVDGLVTCTSQSIASKRCFGDYPGLIWVPSARFGLHPENCYLVGDSAVDVETALAGGSRPLVILCERSIEQVFGRSELDKGFPVAVDLTAAVSYIRVEEEIADQIGHPRLTPQPMPTDLLVHGAERELPTLTITSHIAQEIGDKRDRNRIHRADVARWLFFLAVGALGLSLGIAYLLTHLYRVQPFPEFAYYVTLQFIPRPLRGALFILFGAGIIGLAMRSLLDGKLFRDWFNGTE